MRLTLRTLLAYLDDILDPADKEELAKKIESSDYALDLVHKTRDTVRRLRLSAPQPIGSGMGLDPNTVAEYLDNVMPPDAVGDFERICLESDVHLAEAAACHHVLTMVLGEAADVDPLARQRMYTIASEAGERRSARIEPAHTVGTAIAHAQPAAPVPTAIPVAPRRMTSTEIPDYLRAGAWWRSRGVLAALAAMLVIGIAVFWYGLSGWIGEETSIAGVTSNADSTAATNQAPPFVPAPQPDMSTPATDTASAPSSLGAPPQPLTPGITSAPVATPTETAPASASQETPAPDKYAPVPAETTPPAATVATAENPASAPAATPAEAPALNFPAPPAYEPAAIPPQPGDENATANVAASNAAIDASVAPVAPPPTEAPAPVSGTAAPPTETLATTDIPAAANPDAAAAALPAVPQGPPEFGTYMGAKTVLLRLDPKASAWLRVEPRAAVIDSDRLLALPEFRPKIAMFSGLHLDMSGGTQIVVGDGTSSEGKEPAANASNVPTVEIIYGRIVLINPTNTENAVHLKIGDSISESRLARNSTLAVEVERKYVPGRDPSQAPAPLEARAFTPEGGVVWKDAHGEVTIDKGSRWTIGGNGPVQATADSAPPEWLDHEPIVTASEQRFGAPIIESTLVSNRPADIQLLELFQGSGRKEVKSLVARSSPHVGLFEPFIDALRDSEQKANWKTQIEALRAAMAMSPDSAVRVKKALEDQRGKKSAEDLYEMLCGYNAEQVGKTADQMKAGVVPKLIDRLDNESLDYRVLAAHDLAEITGKRLMPNPAAGATERNQNIRRWRSRLEAGELLPTSQP